MQVKTLLLYCRLGLRPRSHWGSLQRSPRPLAVFKWPVSKGRAGEGTGGEGKRKEGEGEERKGRRRGEKRRGWAGGEGRGGREFVICPLRKVGAYDPACCK